MPEELASEDGNAAIEHADLAEQPDLPVVERVLRHFGAGEMAHQQHDAVVLGADARGKGGRFVRRDAEPVHAGVDMQRRAPLPAARGSESVPFGELDQAADYRPRRDPGEGGRGARHQAAQHIDRRVGRGLARARGFRQVGDEKGLAAAARQAMGDLIEPAAIAVGLDHGGAFGRGRAPRQRAPIGFQRAEIDGEDAAGFAGRRAGGEIPLVGAIIGRGLRGLGGRLGFGHGGRFLAGLARGVHAGCRRARIARRQPAQTARAARSSRAIRAGRAR